MTHCLKISDWRFCHIKTMLVYCGCGIDEGGFVSLLVTVKHDFLSGNG